jgi:glycosyltransferase involved in cell wall biosynthesis
MTSGERPKILFVSGFPEIIGGGQISLMLLLKYLDRSALEPAVIFPREGGYARFLSPFGMKHFFLAPPKLRLRNFLAVISYIRALRRLCARENVAALHCDLPDVALLAGLSALGTGVRLVFHARVSDSAGIADLLLQLLCDRIIPVSKKAAERFRLRPEKCRVIYNGADTDEFVPGGEPALRRSCGIPDDSVVIGYCGQLVRTKGLAVLVEAFRVLRPKYPRARLLLCGRGEMLRELRSLNEPGLHIADFTEDVRPFYSSTDIFVLPTLHPEGFSRVLVESMACGVPAIATEMGGNMESIEDGVSGFLVPPGDAAALAERLGVLLSDEKRRAAMGAASRARVCAMFGARSMARKVGEMYLELFGGKL